MEATITAIVVVVVVIVGSVFENEKCFGACRPDFVIKKNAILLTFSYIYLQSKPASSVANFLFCDILERRNKVGKTIVGKTK